MSILILHIEKKYSQQLGNIRGLPNCWIAEDEEKIWLKSEVEKGAIPMALQQLPAEGRFWVDESDRLFPVKGLTPVAKVPALDWLPVASFVSIEMPLAALPAKVTERISVNLVRSKDVKAANFLLLPWKLWQEYALAASNIRLKPLFFAVSEQAQLMVYGKPLPPLPGQLFWQTQQVLLPAGWDFEYPIMAEIISSTHVKEKGGLLLYQAEQLSELPPVDQFVQASRSAVRKTEKHFKNLV
ncbi:MAG: hypothetical protein KTR30_35450 [Saprospiraceae bacterium]|nr:hypothetical protein [Saprospiraceae bacterium]